jgi:hypothetical protein
MTRAQQDPISLQLIYTEESLVSRLRYLVRALVRHAAVFISSSQPISSSRYTLVPRVLTSLDLLGFRNLVGLCSKPRYR